MRGPLTGFWIKSHSSILQDVTFATLPDTLWRRHHELKLLVPHNAKTGELPEVKAISFLLRVPADQLVAELQQLVSLGLISNEGGGYQLPYFAEEQGPDSVKDRKSRQRERERLGKGSHTSVTNRDPEKKEKSRLDEERDQIESDAAMDKDFSAFWEAYPIKTKKAEAFLAWSNAKRPPVSDLLNAIQNQIRSPKWSKGDGQFIPAPSRWIKEKGWNDKLSTREACPWDF